MILFNFKKLFSISVYFEMSFTVTAKLNFQQSLLQSSVSYSDLAIIISAKLLIMVLIIIIVEILLLIFVENIFLGFCDE